MRYSFNQGFENSKSAGCEADSPEGCIQNSKPRRRTPKQSELATPVVEQGSLRGTAGQASSLRGRQILNSKFQASKNSLTAEKIVNEWSEKEIERILREYGEEKFAKRIAKEIVAERKIRAIQTTFQLKEIIKKATPFWYHRQKTHFATRSFQALRITVNQELENLKKVLPQIVEILKQGGRLVVISFHSLEDRIVKNFFKEQAVSPVRKGGAFKPALSKNKELGLYSSQPPQGMGLSNGVKNYLKILTKKPIRPEFQEIKLNPSSRSAKLRAAQKT